MKRFAFPELKLMRRCLAALAPRAQMIIDRAGW